MKHCEVCTNGAHATISLTGDGCIVHVPLCKGHAKVCTRTVGEHNESEKNEKSENSDESAEEDYESEGQVCGFTCCPSCYDDHTCGDDPTDYC